LIIIIKNIIIVILFFYESIDLLTDKFLADFDD
jgi:hypothetical protein